MYKLRSFTLLVVSPITCNLKFSVDVLHIQLFLDIVMRALNDPNWFCFCFFFSFTKKKGNLFINKKC